jgi:hypothetical protein
MLDREYFMYELYNDFCEVLVARGVLDLEIEGNYLPDLVESYWDALADQGQRSRTVSSASELQWPDIDRHLDFLDHRAGKSPTEDFECTDCLIARTPHP